MPKVKQTVSDLKIHLQEQLQFLRTSCVAFDNGEINEGKRIALFLRVLLHDTNSSLSLLKQLDLKNIEFFSSSPGIHQNDIQFKASLLVIEHNTRGFKYKVPLDDLPPPLMKWMSFNDWWNLEIFMDNKNRRITRKEIINFVVNQDGGAHVDPNLNEVYYGLSRENSISWVVLPNNPLEPNPVLLSIRQIAFEVIKSLNRKGIGIN